MKNKTYQIPTSLQQRISSEQAFHYRIVPVDEENGTLILKTDTEALEQLLLELNIVLNETVCLQHCESEILQRYLTTNYRQTSLKETAELNYTSDFLEKILLSAKSIGSSDIHFEPYEDYCRIRFRLDGKLIEQFTIPIQDYPTMVNKIKVKSQLDIAEKRLPQDGRISFNLKDNEFDIRVSSLPTLYGEKLVLRILSKEIGAVELSTLGFTHQELDSYKEGIKKPNGIVLISGPTGSGKTTTLYATLKLLNKVDVNVLTIEDPIEYTLEGINQVQLKENIGLDFASSLRTFLRQDPDIIMVGEIRDLKTANMAMRAALTGHLVLSTIHTNSSWATISRLVDMGVPPFLLASTLNMSVAQRLVRKLCNSCKVPAEVKDTHFLKDEKIPKALNRHFIAGGCNDCHYTGYKGRQAIYEILPITSQLAKPIKENHIEIEEYFKANKIPTLKTNAIDLVQRGITSIEEVYPLLTN
jgi:type IV pilus assembly protein PilB